MAADLLLIVICWACYATLKTSIGLPLVELISDLFSRSRNSRKRFDPIKFFSFSIFNMDDSPSFLRISTATIALLIIEVALMRLLLSII